ncbi:MAG: cohesin domain-containing protein [Pseudomonadota bacterium]
MYKLFLGVVGVALSVCAQAAQIELKAERKWLPPGEVNTISVEAKDLDNVYGLDLSMTYDPEKIQLVDVDEQALGAQSTISPFWVEKRHFILKNRGGDGHVQLIFSLLRPEEAAAGDVPIAELQFEQLKEGPVNLKWEAAKMGGPGGESMTPDTQGAEWQGSQVPPQSAWLQWVKDNGLTILVTLVVLLLIASNVYWLRRIRKGQQ